MMAGLGVPELLICLVMLPVVVLGIIIAVRITSARKK
jgi:hypothetical protein